MPKAHNVEVQASVFKRITAFLIDMLILQFIVLGPMDSLYASVLPSGAGFSEMIANLQADNEKIAMVSFLSAVSGIFAMLYFAMLESKLGQSIGKMAMKIYVKSDENNLSFWKCLLRSFFLMPVMPFSILMLIDPISAFFTKGNRRLLEMLTKTRTVESLPYQQGF